MRQEHTRVAIVGAGPAGLALARHLQLSGVDVVVVEHRSRRVIETTQRAGILEHGSVRLLGELGIGAAIARDGVRHDGISLRSGGESRRVDFADLVDAAVWLYPQTDVVRELAAVVVAAGGDVRWEVDDVTVDVQAPAVELTDATGTRTRLACDLLVGADGSQSTVRRSLPPGSGADHFVEYPFAWFGVLVEAPPSAPELVYTRSPEGFALLSQRSASVQRMYFQCDPAEDADRWDDERIWAAVRARTSGDDGFTLREGPVIEKSVLPFRSYVRSPLRHGPVLLAGDAGHTVPPTGAKGLNLALSDVSLLGPAIAAWAGGDEAGLAGYSQAALARVWRAQAFSYWMTTLLHQRPDDTAFGTRRADAELASLTASRAGRTYLAEGYTGWPHSDVPASVPGRTHG